MEQSTLSAKQADVKRVWYLIDANGKTLGRLSTQIADLLRGKNKPIFTPHVDTGDFVVVINADKIKLTGNKLQQKMYYHHSGYIGGLKVTNAEKLLEKKPEFILHHAVRGMLPKNKLARRQLKKLKVYRGAVHPHSAQEPQLWETHN
ncbi:MAG: 50S ribosomal protein L13 [bacterium]